MNPNDFNEVAQALHDACQMKPEEKRNRIRLLREIVRDHNLQRWTRSFLQALSAVEVEKQSSGNGGSSLPSSSKQLPGETPGVALVAAAFSSRRQRYLLHRYSLQDFGAAVGDD